MPFWRNDLKIVSIFRQVRTVQRFAISLVLILFPSFLFFIFFYHPSVSHVKQLNHDNDVLIQQQKNLNDIFKKFNQLECENENMRKKIKAMPYKSDVSEFMTSLIQKHGLSCSDIKPIKNKQKDFIKKERFCLSVKGLFKNCVELFEDLEVSGQFIKICELKMCKWKDNKVKFDLEFRGVSAGI